MSDYKKPAGEPPAFCVRGQVNCIDINEVVFVGLLSKAVNAIGLPETVLPGTAEFTVTAGRRLVVWSHNGVIEAMSDLVCLDCGAFQLKIHGEGLKIEAIGKERACVTGRIRAIFI